MAIVRTVTLNSLNEDRFNFDACHHNAGFAKAVIITKLYYHYSVGIQDKHSWKHIVCFKT